MTDLPADANLPLDDPSFIGGPVVVDYQTGDVHDLPEGEPAIFLQMLTEPAALLDVEPDPEQVAHLTEAFESGELIRATPPPTVEVAD
jgi:hypothetical protein